MSNHFRHLLAAGALAMLAAFPASAQMQEPILSFHTTRYDVSGADNAFTFSLGAIEKTKVTIDFGFGPEEYEVGVADFDSGAGALAGTVIEGQVSEEGYVKVYGNPLDIDYLDIEGIYADELDISRLKNLDVLNVSHNLIPELDLSSHSRLTAISLEDNPFDRKPLLIGSDHPSLALIEMSNVGSLDQSFNISDYPNLISIEAFHTVDLRHCDPSGCPKLARLSIDCTNVETLDVSKNPNLLILNISETKIREIDITANTKLQQFYCSHAGIFNNEYKIRNLDVSQCPDLVYLFCSGNMLTELDITGNPLIIDLSCSDNYLPSIDFSGSPDLYKVNIAGNCMDFVTLPAVRQTFGEYYYSQRPIALDRSYPVRGEIDLEARLNRPNSTTTAKLICNGEELSDDYYTYSDGLILFHEEIPDSAYFVFHNTDFTEYDLESTKFVVKSEADYGKDVPMVTYRLKPSAKSVALRIGMAGATEENPKRFSVDFGDGNPVEFTTTTDQLPAAPNASGDKIGVGAMTLYIPDGEDLTAFGMADTPLSALDVTATHSLVSLDVTGCTLSSIDLRYNRCLRSIRLDDNALQTLDLTAIDQENSKNVLSEVYANRNELIEYIPNENRTPFIIELSGNRLTEFSLAKTSYIERLDLAGNALTDLSLQDCEALKYLDVAGNNLASLEVPDYTPIEYLNLSGNRIPLSALPAAGGFDTYIYAPQQPWMMPEKAPSVNLSEQMLTSGATTEFRWFAASDGHELTQEQVVMTNGAKFRFKDTSVGEVYATWTNAAFPDFTGENVYRSTNVVPADMPTHVAASFTTADAVSANLVMTSAIPNNYVYIDWAGDGNVEQYKLSDKTYTIFPVETYADADVKVYTYDERDGISVFSFTGVPMEKMDLSAMTDLMALNLGNDDLTADKIVMPRTSLRELTLSGSDVDGIDFSLYTELATLVLQNCGLTSFDATPFKQLSSLILSNNTIKDVKFDNPAIWELVLVDNLIEEIDLSGVANVEQLWLGQNMLSSIDVSMLRGLKVLQLDNNRFTLTTLPRIMSTYNVYYYGNQALYPVTVTDGRVIDLSDQLMVGVNRTSYRWFRNADIGYYEDGTIGGDEMTPDESYTEEDGVFTFDEEVKDAVCLMTNAAFPDLLFLSVPVDIAGSGVEGIEGESAMTVVAGEGYVSVYGVEGMVTLYAADGRMLGATRAVAGEARFERLAPGIHIVGNAGRSAKVLVK